MRRHQEFVSLVIILVHMKLTSCYLHQDMGPPQLSSKYYRDGRGDRGRDRSRDRGYRDHPPVYDRDYRNVPGGYDRPPMAYRDRFSPHYDEPR